ncbi:NHL repeat-containing protein [Streptomyces gibsoniae]|uniref:NHL repeat containing protein n=1 Tax=Streptomyces gibsoniae TaxID=3075529 RepID=A0ABU2U8G2_9ACTN|nr:hypothetical protein [Streptomyces sp. DSM 41699]MDT0469518.1 hypothetical protein [Streptomyces sp. DSM 41699]
MRFRIRARLAATTAVAVTTILSVGVSAAAAPVGSGVSRRFLGPLQRVSAVASTVPGNGDQNPYGTAVVERSIGNLHRGNILVSNFNNSANNQGTGTTLVEVSPHGQAKLFAQIDANNLPGACPGGVGLTTALTILPGGWVVVGSLPTADGSAATAQAGCLLVLDSQGTVRETFSGDGINGPWDMTAVSSGDRTDLFVTNVLNGTVAAGGNIVNRGTVLRISLQRHRVDPPSRVDTTVIGSGFGETTDPTALVIGPTGVGLRGETLYVADTVGNRITAIPNAVRRHHSAGIGRIVSTDRQLNGPLGLAIAPGGNILTVNGGDGNIVETIPGGRQVAVRRLNANGAPPGAGALFGLAVNLHRDKVYFVNNATNFLDVLSR